MNTIIEQNNTLALTRADLHRTLRELFDEIALRPGRAGLPRLTYRDEFDQFRMRVEKSNVGYSVSCMLNNSVSYQLNGRHFPGLTQIGTVMLIAAGAPKSQTINGFFQ